MMMMMLLTIGYMTIDIKMKVSTHESSQKTHEEEKFPITARICHRETFSEHLKSLKMTSHLSHPGTHDDRTKFRSDHVSSIFMKFLVHIFSSPTTVFPPTTTTTRLLLFFMIWLFETFRSRQKENVQLKPFQVSVNPWNFLLYPTFQHSPT